MQCERIGTRAASLDDAAPWERVVVSRDGDARMASVAVRNIDCVLTVTRTGGRRQPLARPRLAVSAYCSCLHVECAQFGHDGAHKGAADGHSLTLLVDTDFTGPALVNGLLAISNATRNHERQSELPAELAAELESIRSAR
jgi:hypothetical protein